jgi:phospholipid/cholesterol/gamma-HCH transport system substrate-binding protein
MSYRKTEVIVGIFTLLALALLVGVTVNLKKSTLFSRKYPVYAYFKDVKRLEEGAPVYVHGVVRGDVRKLEATGRKQYPVRVTMMLSRGTVLHERAKPRIVVAGLVGETEINIEDTSPTAPVLDPYASIYGEPLMDINDVLAQAPGVIENIQESVAAINEIVSDEQNRRAVSDILVSASSITLKLNTTLGSSAADLAETIHNVRDATAQLNRLLTRTDSILTTVGGQVVSASQNLNTVISELRTSAAHIVARVDTTTADAERLIATADLMLSENRDDVRRAVEGLTSASVHLGRILDRIDAGSDTMADILLGAEAAEDLSRSLDKLEGSLGILRRWLDGVDRWLTKREGERPPAIPYEGPPAKRRDEH